MRYNEHSFFGYISKLIKEFAKEEGKLFFSNKVKRKESFFRLQIKFIQQLYF